MFPMSGNCVMSISYFPVYVRVRELCDVNSPFACLRQGLWFPLLDALMIPQRRIKDSDNKNVLTGNACYILLDNKGNA